MLERAVLLLELFSPQHPRQTISELAAGSGLPIPTVFRICRELTRLGLLERGDDFRFQIGLRVWEIGTGAPRAHELRSVAMPFMEDLHDITRQNVQLVVRDHLEAVYLERLSSHDAVGLVGRMGGRLPLHASSGGLVLLAHADQDIYDAVLAAGPRAFTPHTITDEPTLRTLLAEIRRTGIVVARQYLNQGTLAIAAPIRRGPTVVAALSVVVPLDTDSTPLTTVLQTAGRAISRGLS
ncbi:IclR family transcriptional regulator [Gordonia desulfuricans]|uniref:IclR family transcriptional regulator n=1 Tax=Gordonia desulfuricans TaxID=89051 RepID=A0A7K3LTS0_9ACTN|nr:IclR family transcriptional regulator [Gordonia desulfuricans]NDK91622.1 IclR family transcriptional regulator [Gordonia desulfuricans]